MVTLWVIQGLALKWVLAFVHSHLMSPCSLSGEAATDLIKHASSLHRVHSPVETADGYSPRGNCRSALKGEDILTYSGGLEFGGGKLEGSLGVS